MWMLKTHREYFMFFKTSTKTSGKSRNSRFSKATIAGVSIALAFTVSGCESFTVSDSSKDQGKTVICAAGGGLVSQIRTGGATTKFIAGIVKDNSTGDIQKLAESISSGNGDEEAANKLADYVDSMCN